jgi:predicted RNA polymerase sigma factor
MKYLFLLHTDDGPPEDRASAEYARTYAEYNAAMVAMAEAGAGELGRGEHAAEAYRAALELEPTMAERAFIVRRIGELNPARTDSGSVGWPDDHQPDRGS